MLPFPVFESILKSDSLHDNIGLLS